MNLYKTMILPVFVFLPIYTATPSELKSLAEIYGKTPDRLTDVVEVEYVLHRCAAAYSALAFIFIDDGNKYNDDRGRRSARIGQNTEKMAEPYLEASIIIGTKTGRTSKNALDRIKLLTQQYINIFDRNRDLTNEGISGVIRADLEMCKDIGKLTKTR